MTPLVLPLVALRWWCNQSWFFVFLLMFRFRSGRSRGMVSYGIVILSITPVVIQHTVNLTLGQLGMASICASVVYPPRLAVRSIMPRRVMSLFMVVDQATKRLFPLAALTVHISGERKNLMASGCRLQLQHLVWIDPFQQHGVLIVINHCSQCPERGNAQQDWLIGDVVHVYTHRAHTSMQRNWQLGCREARCSSIVPEPETGSFFGVDLYLSLEPLSSVNAVNPGHCIHTPHSACCAGINDGLPSFQ